MPRPRGASRPPEGIVHLLAGLEPDQQAAVLADEPVVCVLAGAGTGKTRVLTLRVARRIEDGSAHPSHVLVCTFSRKAADELRTRLWSLGAGADVQAGTFHRTALQLLARSRADRGEPPPVVGDRRAVLATMLGTGAGTRASRRLTTHRPARGGARTDVARLDAEIGWAKSRLVAPGDYEDAARSAGRRPGIAAARVATLYERYETARRRKGVLDLDDLLSLCGDLLESDPGFGRAVRWWHRHLFVDEAQDMNEAQYRLLCLLTGDEPDLFVVGDPNQSVYGWNGADPGLLRRITDEFAGTRVVRLDANHRCTPQVVRAAAAVLDLTGSSRPVSTRADGPLPAVACLPTDAGEAAWVARHVWLAHRPGRRWTSIAVLARTNAQLVRIAKGLDAERVPYRIAGRELSPGSDITGADEHRHGARTDGDAESPAEDASMDDASMDDAGTDDAGTDGVPTQPRRDGMAAASRWDGLSGAGTDCVVLSTFHRAKGLQWPAVFVVGLADGIVPLVTARTRAQREEERRLLYVAITRAEDELVCSWALHADEAAAARGDEPRARSPWLEPVARAVEELRQTSTAPDADRTAEHLARIRQLLPSGTGAAQAGQIGQVGQAAEEP